MVFYGVDGCRGGWFFARKDGKRSDCGLVRRLDELIGFASDRCFLFVDIPIGLRDESGDPRPCDVSARRLLGRERARSVFPAPARGVLDAKEYSDAVTISKRLTGKGISRQAFAIVPKIREVDELLAINNRARERVRDVHPELCFWALNGARPMRHRKKSAAGFAERMTVLRNVLPEADALCEEALTRYPRKDVAPDDVADALVALATASAPSGLQLTAPSNPERDSRGLPMQMVYALTKGSRHR